MTTNDRSASEYRACDPETVKMADAEYAKRQERGYAAPKTLRDAAEKLLPQLDNHATVVGCPQKRSLAYRSAEIIRSFLAL